MAATVTINRLTGPAGTIVETPITGLNTRANTADAHSATDTASPIEIPTGADNYSYWVNTQLDCTVAPDILINNIEWYADTDNFGTGVSSKTTTVPRAGYTIASGTTGVTGIVLSDANYSGGSLAPTVPLDSFTYTTGSPLAVPGSTAATGAFGSIVVYQVAVASTADPGVEPTGGPETWTWRYDET